MQDIKVGLIGFGTVGQGLAETLHSQENRLTKRTGMKIGIKTIADTRARALPAHLEHIHLTQDARDILADPEIDIVVELIGGMEPAKTFLLEAIAAGKHVVTANKALLAQTGSEIFRKAAEKGVAVGFEASVGGGIPVIKALREGLVANRILAISGIMNGTANYILSRMTDEGIPFAEVLAEAQKLGFAERPELRRGRHRHGPQAGHSDEHGLWHPHHEPGNQHRRHPEHRAGGHRNGAGIRLSHQAAGH